MRRLFLAGALALLALPALAADIPAAWVRQLGLDGYEEITVSRTWLGRVRIVAEKGEIHREIIINRRTGEVLRDYSRHEDGSIRLPLGFEVELGDDDVDRRSSNGPEDDEEDDDLRSSSSSSPSSTSKPRGRRIEPSSWRE